MQPKFRDVVPHRLLPIKEPPAHQEGKARRGQRLRDRANQERCIGCHLQAGFSITKAVGRDSPPPFCTTVIRGPESSTRPSLLR
jgi:hypothetical protein